MKTHSKKMRLLIAPRVLVTLGFSFASVFSQTQGLSRMKNIAMKGKSFTMGFPTGADTWSCVTGAHKVSFTYDLLVDSTKVTQTDFKAIMGFDPSNNTSGVAGLPVDKETFFDAALYCNARSKRDGLDTVYTYTSVPTKGAPVTNLAGFTYDIHKNGYRIPTNSEYEYLWGAGTTATYFWGEDKTDATFTLYSWYGNGTGSATGGNSGGHSHPVALKKPNPLGLYDISGNLFEWTSDWDSPYPTTDQIDPVGPALGVLNACGKGSAVQSKVCRGGSWYCDASGHQRIRYHYKWPPSASHREIGFRCVATATGSTVPIKQSSSSRESSWGMDRAVRTPSGAVHLFFRTASTAPVLIHCSNAQGTIVRRALISQPKVGANEMVLDADIKGVFFVSLEQSGKVARGSLAVLGQP